MYRVTVRHNFETAHRLPHLGGKCSNLHGHSWWTEITVEAPAWTDDHTVIEFGAFKRALRGWVDTHLDHGAMLGADDPLLPALRADGSKVFVFGEDWTGARWPTVEAVAVLLGEQATTWMQASADLPPGARVTRAKVTETHVNAAEWAAPRRPGHIITVEAQSDHQSIGRIAKNALKGLLR